MDDFGGATFAVAVNDDGNGDSMDPDGGAVRIPDCETGTSGCFALGIGWTGSGAGSGFETTAVDSTGLVGATGATGGRVVTVADGGGTTGNAGGGAS